MRSGHLGRVIADADSEPFEEIRVHLSDACATEAFGGRVACFLRAGDVVFLIGGLGAGKTTFARGVVRAWTATPDLEVPSPTFTLAQVYEGEGGAVWHIDLYRLKSPEEVLELGVEEAFITSVSLIEWPERLGPLAPRDRFALSFQDDGDGRAVILRGYGARMGRLKEAGLS